MGKKGSASFCGPVTHGSNSHDFARGKSSSRVVQREENCSWRNQLALLALHLFVHRLKQAALALLVGNEPQAHHPGFHVVVARPVDVRHHPQGLAHQFGRERRRHEQLVAEGRAAPKLEMLDITASHNLRLVP